MTRFRPSSLCPLATSALAMCPSISQAWHLIDLPNSGENWHILALCPNKGSSQAPDCCPFLAVPPNPHCLDCFPPPHFGTPTGDTSQADGPQIAIFSPISELSAAWWTPRGQPGKADGQERRARDTFINLQPVCQVAQHGWEFLSCCWREVQLGPGGLWETRSRLGEAYGDPWTLVYLSAA